MTSLVGSIVESYSELPLRLYQICKLSKVQWKGSSNYAAPKYRNELRPRQGLFRTREFRMKDLYTFDSTVREALETYNTVRDAYAAFFNELKLPYLVAGASSGAIGGDISHEYHFQSSRGEDSIVSCENCAHCINEEIAHTSRSEAMKELATIDQQQESLDHQYWYGLSKDRHTLVQAVFPRRIGGHKFDMKTQRATQVNPYVLKHHFPFLDLSIDNALRANQAQDSKSIKEIVQIYDHRIPHAFREAPIPENLNKDKDVIVVDRQELRPDLVRLQTGDNCPACGAGSIKIEKAVEVGHTFHLGTRYSEPFAATVAPDSPQQEAHQGTGITSEHTLLQMGCHGIGVSRLIAAVADALADEKGLNWPSSVAPFQVIIVPTKGQKDAAEEVYDHLCSNSQYDMDTLIDDRQKPFGWKMKDADLIGYPVIVVVGRDWQSQRKCEVQCRRLANLKNQVSLESLRDTVTALLKQL